jgi:hypothetical protein
MEQVWHAPYFPVHYLKAKLSAAGSNHASFRLLLYTNMIHIILWFPNENMGGHAVA